MFHWLSKETSMQAEEFIWIRLLHLNRGNFCLWYFTDWVRKHLCELNNSFGFFYYIWTEGIFVFDISLIEKGNIYASWTFHLDSFTHLNRGNFCLWYFTDWVRKHVCELNNSFGFFYYIWTEGILSLIFHWLSKETSMRAEQFIWILLLYLNRGNFCLWYFTDWVRKHLCKLKNSFGFFYYIWT